MARIELKWFSLSTVERERLASQLMLGVEPKLCEGVIRWNFCDRCGGPRKEANADGTHYEMPDSIIDDANDALNFADQVQALDNTFAITISFEGRSPFGEMYWQADAQRELPDEDDIMIGHGNDSSVGRAIVEAILTAYNYCLV